MKTSLASGLALLVVLSSSNVFADDTLLNPDMSGAHIAPKHIVAELAAGPSITAVMGGDVLALSFHAHIAAALGHEVVATRFQFARLSLSVGYVGSADVNDAELIHRHGVGLTIRQGWYSLTASTGVTFGHDFSSGLFIAGAHAGFAAAVHVGPVEVSLPLVFDFVGPAVAMTFAGTLGFKI